MMSSHKAILILYLTLQTNLIISTEGSYVVQVRINSYINPRNLCAECSFDHPFQSPFGCCDKFEETNFCTGVDRCDNYFVYCLREVGTPVTSRDCVPETIQQSDRPTGDQRSGGFIDFSQSNVLGLRNPLELTSTTDQWEGVQLYIEVRDDDMGGVDEVVDTFAIDISGNVSATSQESRPMHYNGTYGISMIAISYRIMCATNYTGELCNVLDACATNQVNCTRNSVCKNNNNTYTCECLPGYEGPMCDLMNHCIEINCSGRGECINEPETYTCDCDAMYTGSLCELERDTCTGLNCTENNMIATTVGIVIGIALTIAAIVTFVAMLTTIYKKKLKGMGNHHHTTCDIVTTPNPGYGISMTMSCPQDSNTSTGEESTSDQNHTYDYVDIIGRDNNRAEMEENRNHNGPGEDTTYY